MKIKRPKRFENSTRLDVQMDLSTHQKLRQLAEARGVTMAEQIRRYIENDWSMGSWQAVDTHLKSNAPVG